MSKCPKCKSTAPHMHPAVQHEGEVRLCTHDFHLKETPQNIPAYVAAVRKARLGAVEYLGGRDV